MRRRTLLIGAAWSGVALATGCSRENKPETSPTPVVGLANLHPPKKLPDGAKRALGNAIVRLEVSNCCTPCNTPVQCVTEEGTGCLLKYPGAMLIAVADRVVNAGPRFLEGLRIWAATKEGYSLRYNSPRSEPHDMARYNYNGNSAAVIEIVAPTEAPPYVRSTSGATELSWLPKITNGQGNDIRVGTNLFSASYMIPIGSGRSARDRYPGLRGKCGEPSKLGWVALSNGGDLGPIYAVNTSQAYDSANDPRPYGAEGPVVTSSGELAGFIVQAHPLNNIGEISSRLGLDLPITGPEETPVSIAEIVPLRLGELTQTRYVR